MRYLTPAILRVSGRGLPFKSVSDLDLAAIIDDAEAQMDSYMGFIDNNNVLGFAYGPRSEKLPWIPETHRVYPKCAPVPVVSVSGFSIVTSQRDDGTPVSAPIPPGRLVVNNDRGYIEPIDLTVIMYGLTPILINMALLRPFVQLDYLAGWTVTQANHTLYSADAAITYHSRIPYWDQTVTPAVITVGGVVANPATYTVDDEDGTVTFLVAQNPAQKVKATFTHHLPDTVITAAKLACIDAAQSYFSNRGGLAGLDMFKTDLGMQYQRKGTSSGPRLPSQRAEIDWRDMLDQMRVLRIGTQA